MINLSIFKCILHIISADPDQPDQKIKIAHDDNNKRHLYVDYEEIKCSQRLIDELYNFLNERRSENTEQYSTRAHWIPGRPG